MTPARDWVTAYEVSGMNTASASEIEEWVGKIQEDAQVRLHADIVKYRIALNQIAHPDSFPNPLTPVEIAKAVLVIGKRNNQGF